MERNLVFGLHVAHCRVMGRLEAGNEQAGRMSLAHLLRSNGAVLCGYLALAAVMWGKVWLHPATTVLCTCGDPGQYLWFMAAPAHSIAHGQSPLFTNSDYAPRGVNLLDNPGVLGLGVLLAPITWLFGPAASLNTALTLAPALSGFTCYLALRRWVSTLSALTGGLFFGFSPFMISSLVVAHLQTAFLAIAPIVLICLDELLVRQQRRAEVVGAALGAAVVIQFFISLETLLIMALSAAIGTGLLIGWTAAFNREALSRNAAYATKGIAVATGLSVLILAYPTWYALDGPRHIVGAPWQFIPLTGNPWRQLFLVPKSHTSIAPGGPLFGYLGPQGAPGAYLGIPLVAAATIAVVVWRHNLRITWAYSMAAITATLSLGSTLLPTTRHHMFRMPWWIFTKIPIVDEASAARIAGMTTLFVAMVLALGMEQLGAEASKWIDRLDQARHQAPTRKRHASTKALGSWLSAAVGLSLLASVAWDYALPPVTQTTSVPQWFTTGARHLPPRSVVMVLPWNTPVVPAWQALSGMSFTLAGGDAFVPGRDGRVPQGPTPGSADSYLIGMSFFGPLPDTDVLTMSLIRSAIKQRHVTTVVVVNSNMRAPAYAAGFLTATLGYPPIEQDGAWVWPNVNRAGPPLEVPSGIVVACGALGPDANPGAVADCVVQHGSPTKSFSSTALSEVASETPLGSTRA